MASDPPRSVLTVSELLRSVRDTLERRFPLAWVRGELSNLNRAPSGHCYFTLKDRGAQVDCVMYRSRAAAFDRELRDGMQVDGVGEAHVERLAVHHALHVVALAPL